MRHNSRCWRDSLRACQMCPRDCSGVLAVTFLEGAQGLLSHVVCVYLGYITHGGAVPVVALAGCYEPTAQVLLYSYTHRWNNL